MIVKNTTDSDVKIQIGGTVYEVKANDELSGVSAEHAKHWKSTHQFLIFSEDEAMEVEKTEVVKDEGEKKEDSVEEEKKPEAEAKSTRKSMGAKLKEVITG